MRVLILSAAILACASARPSGLIAPTGPIVYTAATYGDAQALAIDAKVQAEDNLRQAVDFQRELNEQAIENHNENARTITDQVQEINQENFWNAEEQKWQTYDAIKTAESQLDGAAAAQRGIIAKTVLPSAVAIAQPALAVAQPWAVAQPAVAVAEPWAVAQPLAAQTYSTVVKPETKTIVTQSLSQTHPAPAPAVVSEPIFQTAPIVEAAPIIKSAPILEAAPIIESAPAVIAPAQKTIVTQSLSQTHPSPIIAQPTLNIAQPIVKYAEPVEFVAPQLTQTVVQPETKSVVTSSLSQTHGTPLTVSTYLQPAAHVVSSPLTYSAPIYKSDLVASTW